MPGLVGDDPRRPAAEVRQAGDDRLGELGLEVEVVAVVDDPVAKRAELIAEYRKIIDVYVAAGNDMIDDVIDPRETRATVCRALELTAGKRVQRPWKRSGVIPV